MHNWDIFKQTSYNNKLLVIYMYLSTGNEYVIWNIFCGRVYWYSFETIQRDHGRTWSGTHPEPQPVEEEVELFGCKVQSKKISDYVM